jgi:hypothetical protein
MARASTSGKTIEEYLLLVVEGAVLPTPRKLTSEQRAAALEAWSASHRFAPPLSDHAVSRESIYINAVDPASLLA